MGRPQPGRAERCERRSSGIPTNLLLLRGGEKKTRGKKLHFFLPAGPSSPPPPPNFFFLSPFPVLWAENTSAPLKQVLGLGSWERVASAAAVPAGAGEASAALTPAKRGRELLQPSC